MALEEADELRAQLEQKETDLWTAQENNVELRAQLDENAEIVRAAREHRDDVDKWFAEDLKSQHIACCGICFAFSAKTEGK